MANRSKNIFALLDSDDEDNTPKVTKKTEAAPPSAPVALNKPAAGNKKANKKPFVEGDKKESRAPREPREPREGGRGAGRGGRGGRGAGRGPRREFERRSGTGRGKETSKQGGGARNWGNEADKTEQVAEASVQEGEKVSGDEETPAEEVVEEEEEEVQLSYEEYLAQTKAKRTGELFAEVEVRQVTEDFSGAVQLSKDGKTPDFMESQFEKVFSKKTSGRKKQVITDLGFQSAQPERQFRERDSESRGGRGAGRGGRGGRAPGGRAPGGRAPGGRGGRGGRAGFVPNVADMSAFPTLG